MLTLAQLENTPVDMFTTVYIGNAAKQLGGKMVTPRCTVYEGSGFQRHYRGAGFFPTAGGVWSGRSGQRRHPAGCRGTGKA